MVMVIRWKSALSPPLNVQLNMTVIAPLTSLKRSTQERVETEGEPVNRNSMNLKQLNSHCKGVN